MRAGLFPGQGVPAKTVLGSLDATDGLVSLADDVLGYDLRRRVQVAARHRGAVLPTLVAQPAIFVAGIIALRRAESEGSCWDFLAGHSLGEYTALVAGRALSFEDALKVVRTRAEAMEVAGKASPGSMAAVLGLDFDTASEIGARSGVDVANDNAPGQLVLSGTEQALAEAAGLVRAAGGRSVLLQVSGAFHTQAMAPAAPAVREALAGIEVKDPAVPVVSNVDARPYQDAEAVRELLVRQLTHPVRFRESLEWLLARGVSEFDDLGPGQVVAGLAARTARNLEAAEVPAHA